ncbi:hypothetical protein B0H13DRAFT_551032 [Mycena leptocephala]|nr:hypothetical protein B0H13DRAFT_551032 [Mycena leptocephala]
MNSNAGKGGHLFNVNIYDTNTKKLRRTMQAALTNVLEFLFPDLSTKVYKSPPHITCGTSALRTAAEASLFALPRPELELDASCRLLDVYPWGLTPGEVHFIVDPCVSEDELGTLPSTADLATRRTAYFRSNPSKSPSSEAAKPQSERAMMIGRPTESVLPPSLVDETLCKFRHNVFHGSPATEDFINFRLLRQEMMKTFPKEIDRRTALIDLLGRILPARPEPGGIATYTNDGQLAVTVVNTMFLYYLQEVKNEVTGTSAEPNIEVTRYYIEQCRRCHNAGIKQHCNFPAVLLCQLGPYLVISIAVFTDIPIVEQLVCIPLHAHSTNTMQMEAGARVMAGLRGACRDLLDRYPALVANTHLQADFPFPRSFLSNNLIVDFTYTSALEDKRVYRALLDETKRPIYVKYTLRYCKAAHDVASGLGFAPKLLGIGRVQEWWMVVMEDVSEHYTSLAEAKSQGFDVQGMQGSVKQALHLLHQANYVHGDVRDVNVLVCKPGCLLDDNHSQVLVVDWDWAGVNGEVTYPVALNPAVPRPDGAVAGAVIEMAHDDEMADWLLR